MKITKNHVIGAVSGAVLAAVIYLGYVFYSEIGAVSSHTARLNGLESYVCSKDPVACGMKPIEQSNGTSNTTPPTNKK